MYYLRVSHTIWSNYNHAVEVSMPCSGDLESLSLSFYNLLASYVATQHGAEKFIYALEEFRFVCPLPCLWSGRLHK